MSIKLIKNRAALVGTSFSKSLNSEKASHSSYLRLDMRVGLIRKATKHPDADSLYVEEVSYEHIRAQLSNL